MSKPTIFGRTGRRAVDGAPLEFSVGPWTVRVYGDGYFYAELFGALVANGRGWASGAEDFIRRSLTETQKAIARLTPAYIAHRLGDGPDREANRRSAAAWVGWLARRYQIEPVCPWVTLAEVWPESNRELGLEVDLAAVGRCGLVIACGDFISPGMSCEIQWARDCVDVTGLDRSDVDDVAVIDCRLDNVGIRRREDV